MPGQLRRAAGQDDPGRQLLTPPARISLRSSSNVSRIRASMTWQTSSRLTVRPASSPRTLTLISSSSRPARRSAEPWRILSSSATWQRGLEADRDVVGHVVATDRQDPGVERRALLEQGQVDGPGAEVGDGDAELLLGLVEHRLGGGQRVDHQLVDLHAGRGHALGQVLDRGRRGRDDVGLDLEPQGAHARADP